MVNKLVFYVLSISVLMGLLASSCKNSCDDKTGPVRIQVEFLEEAGPAILDDYILDFKVTQIAFNPGNPMSQIYDIKTFGNGFVAHNARQNRLVIIDQDGEVQCMIGMTGQGPGEFNSLSDFSETPDGSLAILSGFMDKMLFYTPKGEFIREIKVKSIYDKFAYLNDSILVFGSERRWEGDQDMEYYVDVCNLDGKLVRQFFPFYTLLAIGFQAPWLTPWGQDILINKLFDNNYYVLHQDLTMDTLMIFDFGEHGTDFSKNGYINFETAASYFTDTNIKVMGAGPPIPQKDLFFTSNFFGGKGFTGWTEFSQTQLQMYPWAEVYCVGFYKGFPVPFAKASCHGKLAGTMEAAMIFDYWEKHPEQKKRAFEDPVMRQIAEGLDIEGNPVIVEYKLKKRD